MRAISVHLDDASAARLDSLRQTLGLSQSEVVQAGLALLQRQAVSPAALAERLGLIGCFSSGDPGSGPTSHGRNHSAVLRQKLSRQLQQQRQITPRSAI
ncbi:CopG family transcriptional regulator [Cyanobium sp. Cruz-8D1]|uniref:ribbon-helix-helix protein, CopG family n=1 Tax=Cyanobium sp. Cruz-8D1 TaxID=2823711 RepID=UPI0020CECC3C|nr:ribbon-helix-helix protein, CopG family [Cyanobium sp. Cruz-8D1]MCP9868736.1 CopG family transcriptional regulator [Cyanobium sp. Cruz-8D1]